MGFFLLELDIWLAIAEYSSAFARAPPPPATPPLVHLAKFAILRACFRAPKPQNPEKIHEKKIQNPPPLFRPRKIRKKNRKNTKTAQERQFFFAVFVFFRYVFQIFRGRTWGGGFCFFLVYFRDSGVLGLCSRPAGSQTWPRHGRNQNDDFSRLVGFKFQVVC